LSGTPSTLQLQCLLIGQATAFGPNGTPSAIGKQPVERPLWLGDTGFSGDQQGDPRHHGGREKAVHHYPADHYPAWRGELPASCSTGLRPGGFGENLSTTGLTECDVHIGDRWRLGAAVIEVSQPRRPCWKLNLRFGVADMARRVQASGRTGWYYRVLQPGRVEPDARLLLLERPCPEWPLTRLMDALHAEQVAPATLAAVARLAALAESWRLLAQRRLACGQLEDDCARLDLPDT
jgi:MOSC domain-containing protein YiiM